MGPPEGKDGVANQWGRDAGGPTGRSGGMAGLVVTGVLALALGLAGGYATARLVAPEAADAPQAAPAAPASPGPSASVPAVRDGSLYKLYQETQRQREAAMREAGELRMKLVELQSHYGNMEAELQTLRKGADAGEEADTAAEALALSQRQRIEQLEDQVIGANRRLEDANAAVAKANRQKEQALKEAGDLKIRLTQMQSDLSDLETRSQNMELHARQASDRIDAAEKAAELLKQERDRLKADLSTVRAERDSLKAAQKPAEEAPAEPAEEPSADTPAEADQTVASRDRQAVADAIARAPGLKTLDFADRQRLADNLEKGACVTDALEDIFVRVPVLTLRSLIRDLDSPC